MRCAGSVRSSVKGEQTPTDTTARGRKRATRRDDERERNCDFHRAWESVLPTPRGGGWTENGRLHMRKSIVGRVKGRNGHVDRLSGSDPRPARTKRRAHSLWRRLSKL